MNLQRRHECTLRLDLYAQKQRIPDDGQFQAPYMLLNLSGLLRSCPGIKVHIDTCSNSLLGCSCLRSPTAPPNKVTDLDLVDDPQWLRMVCRKEFP